MPDLLLELFSEEIPARMQTQAGEDLKRLVTDALVARGLTYAGAAAFSTPRRLTLHVADLPAAQPDTREERKGPKVGAPEAAVVGFLRSAGLASLDEAKVSSDPKKGDFYVAIIERRGRPTLDVLAELLPPLLENFPWPKSMRWGEASLRSDSLRWVRPLQSILATFGPETEEPEIVPFSVGGISVGEHHPRPSLHGAGRRSRCGGSTITGRRWSGRRWCSIRRGGATSSSTTPVRSRWRRGSI